MDDLFIAVLIDSTDELVARLSRVGESAHPLREVWACADDSAGARPLLRRFKSSPISTSVTIFSKSTLW